MKTLGLFQELAEASIEFLARDVDEPDEPPLDSAVRAVVRAGARARLVKALHDSAPLLPHQTAARIRQVLATRADQNRTEPEEVPNG